MGVGSRNSNFAIGIATLLLGLVLGSSFLSTTMAASANEQEDESAPSSCKKNPRYHPKDETLLLYHFESTRSTQDEAKKITLEDEAISSAKAFCVTATEQTNGRGTSGRLWMGARGNTFVTIGIPQSVWMRLNNVPLTLLPLRIGSLVAYRVQELLDKCRSSIGNTETGHSPPIVAVKWPNDILVDEKKISGVLIESSNGWFLVGIGVNLVYAPPVPTSGPNNGRQSTCIQDFCPTSSSSEMSEFDLEVAARHMGVDLAHDLNQWLQTMTDSSKAAQSILEEWKRWANWDMELIMRDTPNHERVQMADLLPDGRIQVIRREDGSKRTLVSDYFL